MSAIFEVLMWTLGLSLLLAIIYRKLTNPEEMRRIKANMKEIQDKVKKAQKAGDMDQASALTSEMLKGSQQQFSQNMKPMMVSMVIFFVFIGWIGAQYGGIAVANEQVSISIEGAESDVFMGTLTGGPEQVDFVVFDGTYEGETARIHIADTNGNGDFSDDMRHITIKRPGLFGSSWEHKGNDVFSVGDFNWGNAFTEKDDLSETQFSMFVPLPFALPIFGHYINWIWWYIIITLPGTLFFRKMLGVE